MKSLIQQISSVCVFILCLPSILSVEYSTEENSQSILGDNFLEIQDILDVPSENLFVVPAAGPNATNQIPIISVNCSLAFEKFSDSVVNFTRCTVNYARPIRICMKCVNEYRAFEAAYANLKKQTAECQLHFFSSDQLGIVDIVYNGALGIWKKSFCENCFKHLNQTQLFFQLTNDLEYCIQHSNKSAFLSPNSTCEECRPVYANLSSCYHEFVSEREEFDQNGGVCMDIVDSMNISRIWWNKFKCSTIFESSIGFLNILTALTVGATPAMFYLTAKNISSLEVVKLVRPKRKVTIVPVNRPEH